jgi:hypothetical protein
MKNKIIEIQVTGCNNCPACDGEFETCQVNNMDRSQTLYGELPKKCPLRKADVILKLKTDVMGNV